MSLLACAVAVALAADKAPPAEKAPAEKVAPAKPITMGISQPYGPEQAQKAKVLIEPYLTKELKTQVTVTVFPTYDELSAALAEGKVDLAWITPLAFVQANDKNAEVTALSKAMRQGGGGLFYRAVFIAKKGSSAANIADLKGKKVAWVNKSSTSGYLFPREMIKKAGFEADGFFASETMAGDHPAVCKAVKSGSADFGATFAQDPGEGKQPRADGCADAGGSLDDYKVVAASGPIPNEVLACRPDFAFDRKRTNGIIQVFGRMSLSDEGKRVLKDAFRVDGWGIAIDGDFDPVIDLLRAKNKKAKVAPAE
ncbi:MAG: phosphate/phosphite/phosphonate ABC transporter substrate-binding protein [Myxococcaceae bacterium]|nr:phosphate/phosphite/phosphonate ABC transporter substrate-binding protein [Myxococcaceae bacterium]